MLLVLRAVDVLEPVEVSSAGGEEAQDGDAAREEIELGIAREEDQIVDRCARGEVRVGEVEQVVL